MPVTYQLRLQYGGKMESEERERRSDTLKTCQICRSKLKEPFIKCCQCPKFFQCLSCFAKGLSKGKHENDHSYEIMRNNFCIWSDDQWTAAEELKLLEGIDDCGLGNWADVGKYLRKPAWECESHYMHYYIEHPQEPLQLATFSGNPEQFGERGNGRLPPLMPYRVSDDPPRPQLDSVKQAEMAGYYAARGDFITEYNNYAEMNLRDVKFEEVDDDLEKELKLAKVDIYNNQLRERARRKRLLRHYGMIDVQQAALIWQQRYEHTIGRDVLNAFRPLMNCMPAEQFECSLESLHYELELQQKIVALQEYRKCGLTTFSSAKLYHKIKQRRDEESCKRTSALEALAHLKAEAGSSIWQLNAAESPAVVPGHAAPRRTAPPLDVVGLPGYEKLNAKERELCSTVRLVPEAYLEFKTILINENLRYGRLRLAQARQLIKIDVNKTRKLYDFLVQEGSIIKDG